MIQSRQIFVSFDKEILMGFRKLAFLMSTILLLSTISMAQTGTATPDAEKEKKKKELDERVVQMLEQAIADAPTLRLPQNRAIVYALAADLYWKFDEKRSRDLLNRRRTRSLHSMRIRKGKNERARTPFLTSTMAALILAAR